MPSVVGIDPGSDGYLCHLGTELPRAEFLPMPFIETGKRISEVNIGVIADWLQSLQGLQYVVLEDVGYLPAGKSGFVGSGFSDSILSRRVGELVGMLKTLKKFPYEMVASRKWHSELGITIAKVANEKHAARKKRIKAAVVAWCGRRYPTVSLVPGKCRTPQDGMADALAMAHLAATRCLGYGVTP